MNYQFTKDPQGKPIARFEMGCEAFSQWFSDELGADHKKINTILDAIKQLHNKELKEYVLRGQETSILLDADEVEVRSNMLNEDTPEEIPEGTELYDQELMAGCGLEDFVHVLHSWKDYVVGN